MCRVMIWEAEKGRTGFIGWNWKRLEVGSGVSKKANSDVSVRGGRQL